MQNISSILRRELKFRISVKKGGEKVVDFYKSDVGAQAAWKGFSSQTLYIASRLISDEGGYEYYPEDIEDLVVKKNGAVVEAVQVKNISADITLSSLAATKTSQSGEGFFNRMCSLHKHLSDVLRLSTLTLLVLNCRKYKKEIQIPKKL